MLIETVKIVYADGTEKDVRIISELSEIRAAGEILKEAHKSARRQKAKKIKRQLKNGQRVTVNDKGECDAATIVKINQTRAICDIDGKGRFNVPLTIIEL